MLRFFRPVATAASFAIALVALLPSGLSASAATVPSAPFEPGSAVISADSPASFSATPAPVLSGSATVGSVLTGAVAAWTPTVTTMGYQWFRGDTAIPGATNRAYRLAAADLAQRVTLTGTGSLAGYSTASATSSPTDAVAAGEFSSAPVPGVAGTAALGSSLTTTVSAWTPGASAYTYQWLRDGVVVIGATTRTHLVVPADVNQRLSVTAVGSRSGYSSLTLTSPETAVITGSSYTRAPVPVVTGTRQVSRVLTGTANGTTAAGTWSPSATAFGYQWKRNGVAISGATKRTYALVPMDAFTHVTVTVGAQRPGFTNTFRTSTAGTAIATLTLTAAPTPTISGSPTVGSTLKANAGSWQPATVALTYQWKMSGTSIPGATASTFVLRPTDAGKTFTVVVRGAKPGYSSISRISAATHAITVTVRIPKADGEYTVGSQVAPGTYAATATVDGCYWERNSALTGDNNVITAGVGYGQVIVTIAATDIGFYSEGCGAWVRLTDLPSSLRSPIPEGVWAVGQQVNPGLYSATAGADGCFWATLSGFGGEEKDALAYDGVDSGPVTVRIGAAARGFESTGCGTWTRIGD